MAAEEVKPKTVQQTQEQPSKHEEKKHRPKRKINWKKLMRQASNLDRFLIMLDDALEEAGVEHVGYLLEDVDGGTNIYLMAVDGNELDEAIELLNIDENKERIKKHYEVFFTTWKK